MNEPIIRIADILTDARNAAESRKPDMPAIYQDHPTAAHRWLTEYHARAGELARQKTAA